MTDLTHTPILDPGRANFEKLVRESFPEFWVLIEDNAALTEVSFHGSGVCARCGVLTSDKSKHREWHRHLTIGTHLNAWLAGRAHDAMRHLIEMFTEGAEQSDTTAQASNPSDSGEETS